MNRTATNQNRYLQPLETFPTPHADSHGCDNLRTTSAVGIGMVTGGVAPQSFCQHYQASSLPSGSTHGAHGARTTFDFGSRQEFSVTHEQTPQFVEQSWGMNNAIALPQQLLRMPEEHRYQGSWEQNWGFDNAILLSQQPQGTSMEDNQPQGSLEQNLGTNNADSTSRHFQWEVNGRTPNIFPIPQQPLGTAQQTNSGLFWQQTSRMGGSIPMPQQNPVRDELNSQPLPWEQHWGMTNGVPLPQQSSNETLVDRVWEMNNSVSTPATSGFAS